MSITRRLVKLKGLIPSEVKIVAVSKFHSSREILEAYDAGQYIFGESRVQELVQKQKELPKDIEWHFIGNLQRNKVKQIAPFISLIHSMDSERLMHEIEKQGALNGRVIPCLLQVHIAEEDSKSGFSPGECLNFLAEGKWKECEHVQIRGVMGMATFSDNTSQVRSEFRRLSAIFKECRALYFKDSPYFNEISMGMTGDYPIAIDEGSTMIRIGTLIFGERK